MTTVLVTGAGGSAAFNLCDSLRRSTKPYQVIGTDSSPARLHLSNADECLVLPRAEEHDYADALLSVVKQWDVEVVLPQPDVEVLAIGALRDVLPAAVYLPSQEALQTASDKAAFSFCMAKAGVQVPLNEPFADSLLCC